MITCPYGFRILGPTTEERRLVDAAAVFAGYAACAEQAEVHCEAYLSAFCFGDDFRQLLESAGSTRGFAGACWAPWVWFDIDRAGDLDAAVVDARRLAAAILERFSSLDDDDLLLFYSGSKGFHLGVSTLLWQPAPSPDFHRTARRFAESIAERIGVAIDGGVYDRVRAFRAPNSRHPKTGRHKRRLSFDELTGLSLDGILRLAEQPAPFDVPGREGRCEQAAADWQDSVTWVRQQSETKARRQAAGNCTSTLNRLTLDFIRDGTSQGDRHRLLFSAAANLAEFGCPPALAHALLTPAALDSGLAPREVHRQIECGLAHSATGQPSNSALTLSTPAHSTAPCSAPATDPEQLQAQLAALWAGSTVTSEIPTRSTATPSPPPSASGPISFKLDFADDPPEHPTPPLGAELFYQDARGRPCEPNEAYRWTWAKAPQWFRTAEHPVPVGASPGGQP